MFAPTKTWRRWHRKVNVNLKRYAVASALAASALPSLVMARGHRVDAVPELPLVVDDSAESLTKTAKAVQLLEALGAGAELARARDARNIRKGKGKLRNRRYVGRRGPLVVYAGDGAVSRAFRAIPGVDTASVDRLNLLQLAPGGHVGRLIVWTKGAFERLEALYGAGAGAEAAEKKGYSLPAADHGQRRPRAPHQLRRGAVRGPRPPPGLAQGRASAGTRSRTWARCSSSTRPPGRPSAPRCARRPSGKGAPGRAGPPTRARRPRRSWPRCRPTTTTWATTTTCSARGWGPRSRRERREGREEGGKRRGVREEEERKKKKRGKSEESFPVLSFLFFLLVFFSCPFVFFFTSILLCHSKKQSNHLT